MHVIEMVLHGSVHCMMTRWQMHHLSPSCCFLLVSCGAYLGNMSVFTPRRCRCNVPTRSIHARPQGILQRVPEAEGIANGARHLSQSCGKCCNRAKIIRLRGSRPTHADAAESDCLLHALRRGEGRACMDGRAEHRRAHLQGSTYPRLHNTSSPPRGEEVSAVDVYRSSSLVCYRSSHLHYTSVLLCLNARRPGERGSQWPGG